MSNKYVREAMENNSKLPKTLEEFSQMHTADAARVPMSHIQKLRAEFNSQKAKDNPSSFLNKTIEWD